MGALPSPPARPRPRTLPRRTRPCVKMVGWPRDGQDSVLHICGHPIHGVGVFFVWEAFLLWSHDLICWHALFAAEVGHVSMLRKPDAIFSAKSGPIFCCRGSRRIFVGAVETGRGRSCDSAILSENARALHTRERFYARAQFSMKIP